MKVKDKTKNITFYFKFFSSSSSPLLLYYTLCFLFRDVEQTEIEHISADQTRRDFYFWIECGLFLYGLLYLLYSLHSYPT